jgi:hypothetical protein
MTRLTHRAELALAEDAGQHGERGRQAVPQVAGVRIRSGLEQHPGAGERGGLADGGVVTGVGQMGTAARSGTGRPAWSPRRGRRPGARPAAAGRPPRRVGRHGGGVHAEPGDLRVAQQDLVRLRPASWLVILVVQAGQAKELVGRLVRSAGHHPLREPAVPLDDLDVPAQPGPARQVVAPGHDQLGGTQREHGGRGLVRGPGRMTRGQLGERVLIAAAYRALQVPGLVAQLLEAGLAGQVGHGRSFRAPAVRVASRKEGCVKSDHRPRTGGLCPSRGPGVPCEPGPFYNATGPSRRSGAS